MILYLKSIGGDLSVGSFIRFACKDTLNLSNKVEGGEIE